MKEEIFKKHFILSNIERHGLTEKEANELYEGYKNHPEKHIKDEFDSAVKVITSAMEEYYQEMIKQEQEENEVLNAQLEDEILP